MIIVAFLFVLLNNSRKESGVATSWIDQKAEEYKKREQELQRERDWRLYESSVIESKWLDVKDGLETVVRDSIAEWNIAFPQNDTKIDGVFKNVIRGFKIHKTHYPAGTVTVSFEPVSREIRCDIVKVCMVGAGDYTSSRKFYMHLAKDDSIYITDDRNAHLSANDVARIIIESITEN